MAADFSTTHFELFGLPETFDVDPAALDERYRELQRTVHPDRFVNATDQERRLSMQQATRINEGYEILKDPLKRGRYLLELAGHRFDDEKHTTSDTEFLMEQMELREALGDVRVAANALAELGKIMDRITADIDALTTDLHQQFAGSDPVQLEGALTTLVKMQFFRRLQEEVLELEATLEDEIA